MKFTLQPGSLSIEDIKTLLKDETTLELSNSCLQAITQSEQMIAHILKDNQAVYGINTGFGMLASTRIKNEELEELQRKIVISHAAGVGELMSDDIVRLIMALKINSLARGFSGVKLQTIEALITLFNAKVYPCIPEKGSVGASGDLAPLAHMATVLIGVGHARYQGKVITAEAALKIANLSPLTLGAKEGLALLNGTQASTALALVGWLKAENAFITAITAGALSVEAAAGSDAPFDARIQTVRGHASQIQTAAMLRELLQQSDIRNSHINCNKVQDPYSLRCQPQVMGACLTQLLNTKDTLLTEANGVSDNPLVFAEDKVILSGGNFHAEPVAMAADMIAISLAEMGALSERRIALLVDPHFNSGLPAFLVKNPGLNSGFMIAQVSAAALASENKTLCFPSSVDSLPTSANQEDHVSMATHAARRLLNMADNTYGILAIELLAACQGIDLRRPLKTSARLEVIHQLVRQHVPYYQEDRYFAPDIAAITNIINDGSIRRAANLSILN